MVDSGWFVHVWIPKHIPVPWLTYAVPVEMVEQVARGKRVVVPLAARRHYAAIVVDVHQRRPEGHSTRFIESVLDEIPLIPEPHMKLWEWMSQYYMAFPGDVMNIALPASLKLASETRIELHTTFDLKELDTLPIDQQAVVEVFQTRDYLSIQDMQKILPGRDIYRLLRQLVDKQVLVASEKLVDKNRRQVQEEWITLAETYKEEAKISALMDETERRAPRQNDVLLVFFTLSNELGPVERSRLLAHPEVDSAALKALEKKGVLVRFQKRKEGKVLKPFTGLDTEIELSEAQRKALEETRTLLQSGNKMVLLHGLTGSGKTQIYARLMEEQLREGKEVLYLVPEIALTTQLITRIKVWFGSSFGVYHSRITEKERSDLWFALHRKEVRVVIGPRSALFLPFQQLGLVIIDEEHEQSYRQSEQSPHYHARDVAAMLARFHGSGLLLGSATPSIEVYQKAKKGEIGLVKLEERFQNRALPEVELVDLAQCKRSFQMVEHLSQPLIKKIQHTLDAGDQTILFLNRRGYFSQLTCVDCGEVRLCPSCDIGLTYHKYSHTLKCHICGFQDKEIQVCKHCGSTNLTNEGFGTEMIEEEVKSQFPEARVARMDLETTRESKAFEGIIQKMENREIDILVGTQMVTKGFDFDHVTLVGVLNADQSLYMPDFRALERSFQLLTQVAGRAGRKDKLGQVMIQTYRPKHFVFGSVLAHDYLSFFEDEIKTREQFGYPPFTRIIQLSLRHPDQNRVDAAARFLAERLRAELSNVLGPSTPGVSRIRNAYIREIFLKFLSGSTNLKAVKNFLLTEIQQLQWNEYFRPVQVYIDVDP